MMYMCVVLCVLGWARAQSVTVEQRRLPYDEVHTLSLNSTVEYILEFIPETAPASDAPPVVWLSSDGGDITHPVLVTSRQRSGAVTWQLPYEVEGRKLYELERTLCPDDTALAINSTDCEGEARSFSLHVSTSCAAARVSVRATRPALWRLPRTQPTTVEATRAAPRVMYYQFPEDEDRVRLVVASDSDVCATLSVQNYTCPIQQSTNDGLFMRLTMMRSGAMQISRAQYPLGFYVVVAVWQTDEACTGEAEEDADWVWRAALLGDAPPPRAAAARRKELTITMQAALSRSQYLIASVTTMAIFLGFYVAFGALVLAQRWPPFAKYVAPKAVLAKLDNGQEEAQVTTTGDNDTATPSNRRRGSNDTYDRSDDSDTDEEHTDMTNSEARNTSVADDGLNANGRAPPAANGNASTANASDIQNNDVQGPFGLPSRLRLAALAKRRGRTLRARSDRYFSMLYTVAVFYALPVIQFVIAFQVAMNLSGSLDICYYNFLCAHPAGALADFNHVLSNLGYLLLGALFMLQVRRRRARRNRQPRHEDYGIPAHYGMLSALGAGMMVVAVLSASYHVCPNALNFQFDTAFMYVLAVLSMVKIYQARHPDVNARAHATYGVLALIIALVVWGVLGGGPLFWGVFTVLHIFTFLLLSLRIYYLGQFRLEKQALAAAASELRRDARPLYGARLVLLLIANALNWLFAIYGLLTQSSDVATHILQVLLGNTLMYMVFYLAMKLVHGERVRWYSWAMLLGAAATWVPALFFFVSGSTDWSATPAMSRHKNHECKVMQFYDSHDLWHMLSAVALYLSFNTMLTWDDGLSAVKRTEIAVF